MLAHGMMDNNVPPYNTLLVVEALEKANKSFDLVIFPNSPHGYGPYGPYMMRRRWDYFVKNLRIFAAFCAGFKGIVDVPLHAIFVFGAYVGVFPGGRLVNSKRKQVIQVVGL
jgi:hypothetical protein